MTSDGAESAVVVRLPIPRALERIRQRRDVAAGVGVPAHVTILYPFVDPDELDAGVRRELAAIAAGHAPFRARFDRVERWPGVVYLPPEPAAPFSRLIADLIAAFPDHPPYGGAFDEVIPHLTITESADAPLEEIAASAARWLPFERPVTRLEVLVEDGIGRWHSRWRLPLGAR
ncbi:MAG TPA: 2'-5' RNA ligase family protein [Candidatus Limnocylindrales bacterium]|jgi:2'-5' RNA ligase|nr:2'-5' RNA ligase family protein [Candidatus Limnocylindrales bacterium]